MPREISPAHRAARVVILRGFVEPGAGEAAGFMSLDWVRRAVSATVGFEAYPGTLNVRLVDEALLARWREIRRDHARPLPLPPDQTCGARVVPVTLSDIPAAVIIPEITRYGAHVMEVIAPVHLRTRLWLRNRDVVTLIWKD
jgi:riboflavin kinase